MEFTCYGVTVVIGVIRENNQYDGFLILEKVHKGTNHCQHDSRNDSKELMRLYSFFLPNHVWKVSLYSTSYSSTVQHCDMTKFSIPRLSMKQIPNNCQPNKKWRDFN